MMAFGKGVKNMDLSGKKLLASVVAIAMIASVGMGFVMTGTAAGQSPTPTTCPLDEDFSVWLPSGWTQEQTFEWEQSSTSNAGGASPEAVLPWYQVRFGGDYAYLDSKPVDTTGAASLMLEFKSHIHASEGPGDYTCRVYTRADGGDTRTDVTPWSNPIYSNIGPNTYLVDISPDIGSATQVRFEFDGDWSGFEAWYVDDVEICGAVSEPEPVVGVGGEAYPVNKISLLVPWIAVAVLLAGGISCYASRRRRAQG